jgi:hypothetical protein
MKINKTWLAEKNACSKGIEWFNNQSETDALKIIENFVEKKEHLDWANWLIARIMSYKQHVSYAVYAADQVLYMYENKYPSDKRPRAAIEAARVCIENPFDDNKKAVSAAAHAAASAAADAAVSADAAAAAAAYAAYAASAYAYADAASHAASAAHAAYAASAPITKILKYGLELLNQKK